MGGIGCDNMTAVLVCLLQNHSYADFKDHCATPAEVKEGSYEDFVTPEISPVKTGVGTEVPFSWFFLRWSKSVHPFSR